MKPADCEICTELDTGRALQHYLVRGIPASGRILTQSENYVLVPDYAPLMTGHILLLPREHSHSIADNLAIHTQRLDEMFNIISEYENQYGPPTILEHGSTKDLERDRPCIAHAHLHLLPISPFLFRRTFSKDAGTSIEKTTWHEVHKASAREYVLVGDVDNVDIAIDWAPPERQYARTLTGRILNLPDSVIHSDTCVVPNLMASTLLDWKHPHANQTLE